MANFMDKIRERILKFLKINQLDYNPYSERFTFIGDEKNILEQQLKEYEVWYSGDSNELLNFYTNQSIYGNAREPIYNRNRRNYFWEISSEEAKIKRVHSGIPHAIITTLVNAIGSPEISSKDVRINTMLDNIIEKNDFINILNQQQMPFTMVDGWGAFKINIEKELSDAPIIQYYDAKDVEFIYKSGILLGIIYKDYYRANDRNYILTETRRLVKNNGITSSVIEYQLFRLENKDEATPCDLTEVPELANYQNLEIPNYKHILGVPCRFLFDKNNKSYGRSFFANKVDLFDDLDQILSQDSQSVRVSTPVEYYPVDIMERSQDGIPQLPSVYNRQFIKLDAMPNGDGDVDSTIQTTQPQLNFEQYSQDAMNKLDFILTGLLSPATMGIDIAKKDNADAQREKEKITIMTRNNVINRETRIIKELFNICLAVQEFIDTGKITLKDYDIDVKFNEFANPSFENEIQILGNAWSNGQISTDRYVDLLWNDKLTDEEKAEEVAKLEKARQQDNLMMGDFEDEGSINGNLQEEESTGEDTIN